MTIHTRDLPYDDLGLRLTGLLCYGEQTGPRPGILLIHGGAGFDQHAKDQARRYAELGYTVLACDLFGVSDDRERVLAAVKGLHGAPDLLVRRCQAALTALADCPETSGRTAAVGFCFGGMAALTLARAGVGLAGAVSVHGSLTTTAPAEPGAVTARILALHGAADPHVPMTDVVTFTEEMSEAGADWQLIAYGGAQHGFTHAHAVDDEIPGVAYHQATDERSFAAARAFLEEVLS